jgi:hypothetical protein
LFVADMAIAWRCNLASPSESFVLSGGDAMNSTSALKIHKPDARGLIEKIKDEIKKRAEAKARRMMLKVPSGL